MMIRLLILLALLWPSTSWAAIAFDAAASGNATGTSLAYSHTVSGSDRVLIVGVTLYSNSTQTVSTVTYNGVSMTLIPSCTAEANDLRVEQWYLVAPATGANNVVVTPTATTPAISSVAASFTGVDQSTPIGTCATATGTSTGPSVNVTSAAGEVVVDTMAFWGSGSSPSGTQGASQTFRDDDFYDHAFGRFYNAVSTEAGAGTVTMSWTIDDNHNWAIAGTPLKEASGGGGGTVRNLLLMGVGQ